jgi:hypothetical protein
LRIAIIAPRVIGLRDRLATCIEDRHHRIGREADRFGNGADFKLLPFRRREWIGIDLAPLRKPTTYRP